MANKLTAMARAGFPARDSYGVHQYFESGEWKEIPSDHPEVFSAEKAETVEDVVYYAENMRSRFTEGAAKGKLSDYQMNSDIINLLDAGVVFADLDSLLKQKVEAEVEADNRYTTTDELITVWRTKRGRVAVINAWAAAIENNTLTAVNAATTKAEIDDVLAAAKLEAEAKADELTINLGFDT